MGRGRLRGVACSESRGFAEPCSAVVHLAPTACMVSIYWLEVQQGRFKQPKPIQRRPRPPSETRRVALSPLSFRPNSPIPRSRLFPVVHTAGLCQSGTHWYGGRTPRVSPTRSCSRPLRVATSASSRNSVPFPARHSTRHELLSQQNQQRRASTPAILVSYSSLRRRLRASSAAPLFPRYKTLNARTEYHLHRNGRY